MCWCCVVLDCLLAGFRGQSRPHVVAAASGASWSVHDGSIVWVKLTQLMYWCIFVVFCGAWSPAGWAAWLVAAGCSGSSGSSSRGQLAAVICMAHC
jgi:hypothetical protein